MTTDNALATQGFDESQVSLIKRQIAPAGTTDDELALFLAYAQRTGLDPFSRQIYLSERRSNVNGQWVVTRKPEVTIDGFRLIAERTKQYAGQVGPFWCGADGQWKDVWLDDAPPSAARLGVLRHDFNEPLWSVALYREYAQMKSAGGPNSMWAKYPSVMLAKCAESLALRRAFPRELSGLYTKEEMPEEREDGKKAAAEVGQERIRQLQVGISAEERDATLRLIEVEMPAMGPGPAPTMEAVEQRAAKTEKAATKKATKQEPPKVGYEMLGHFKEIKKMLNAESGSDDLYYGVLAQYQYKKSSDIPDVESARIVYKSLNAAHKSIKTANANRAECQEIFERVGADRFWAFAGSEGLDMDAYKTLAGDELQAFANNLRAEFPV